MPKDAHARSIVLHQALHQLLLEEFTHGADALPRGGCRRPLERIVFELELLNLMQIADGGLERDEKVLGSVQLLEHAQLGERDGQVLELIGAHIEILEWQSESIRVHPRPSEAIRGYQRQSAHLELLQQFEIANG